MGRYSADRFRTKHEAEYVCCPFCGNRILSGLFYAKLRRRPLPETAWLEVLYTSISRAVERPLVLECIFPSWTMLQRRFECTMHHSPILASLSGRCNLHTEQTRHRIQHFTACCNGILILFTVPHKPLPIHRAAHLPLPHRF